MPVINWGPEMELGIDELDIQHRKLLDLINGAYDAIASGTEESHAEELLEGMMSYAKMHFAFEERIFKERKPEEYENHRLQHRKFYEEALTFQSRYPKDTALVKMFSYLNLWLLNHIMHEDCKLL